MDPSDLKILKRVISRFNTGIRKPFMFQGVKYFFIPIQSEPTVEITILFDDGSMNIRPYKRLHVKHPFSMNTFLESIVSHVMEE